MIINLSKLLLLIEAVGACPVGVPKRVDKLYNDYNSFEATSDHTVSVQVAIALERLVETNVDKEDEKKKKLVIKDIIETYSQNSFRFPAANLAKIYLISPLTICDICGTGSLVVVKPKHARQSVVYTAAGGQECELYHKY